MTKLPTLLLLLLALPVMGAESFYLAQSAAGSGDGSSCGNAKAATFFNNAANWGVGAGKISPDDTVELCGTITTVLIAPAGGSSGHPVTIHWQTGAKLSQPAASVIGLGGFSYFILDGGVDGIIENTANGTLLANQLPTSGIIISGSHDIELKNLTIRNLYVHVAGYDGPDLTAVAGIYASPAGANINIHDCHLTGMYACIRPIGGVDGISGFICQNNTFSNFDHGLSPLNGFIGALIKANSFGSSVNWDNPGNIYHHDDIHFYGGVGGTLFDSYTLDGNLFHGDKGTNNTAMVFFEPQTTGNTNAVKSPIIINNVFSSEGSHVLNNGFMNPWCTNGLIANNTMRAVSTTPNSQGLTITGTGNQVTNNAISGVTVFVTINTPAHLNNNYYGNPIGPASWKYLGTTYTSFPTWQTALSGDFNSQSVADLAIQADGSLGPTSVAIGGGLNLTSLFTDSFNLVTRPTPPTFWDAGAWQSTGFTNTPTPPVTVTGKVRFQGVINLGVR